MGIRRRHEAAGQRRSAPENRLEHLFTSAGSKLEVTEKIHTDDLAEPELVAHTKIDILGAIEVAQAPSGVTETSATLKGTVNPEGANVTKCTFEYGTGLPSGKTAPCTSLPGAGKAPVTVETAPVTGLTAGTKYVFKLIATNTDGTSESPTATFETTAGGGAATPVVTVEAPGSVTEAGATLKGAVNPEGTEVKSCTFEYGPSLPLTKTASCTTLPGSGKAAVGVSAAVTGLAAGTKYTFKLTATNTGGTGESSMATFETPKAPAKPRIVTEAPESVTETGAKLKGTVNPEGSEVKSCSFEYGTSLPSGKTLQCTPATIPTGTSPVAVSATVTGLAAGTKYSFKLTATNTGGSESATGTFESFKATETPPPGPVAAAGGAGAAERRPSSAV